MAKNSNKILKNSDDNKKRIHDLHASIRFLENLHAEISLATSIEEIKDPQILKKFKLVIILLKKELNY